MEPITLPKKIQIESEENNTAVVVIEPLFPGYGTTVGNSLRRVLLSSLPGAAITAVKVKGISHEFSTLKYIKEDMVEMILNLKQVRLKTDSEEPVRMKLAAKGKKEITAGDFEKISNVEIVNPDQLIATATHQDADFEMEVLVQRGRGYLPVEQRNEELEIGMIAIDAIFTPIVEVNGEIENIRVRQRTDFDQLKLTITTDGTITPRQALADSAKILIDHFGLLADPNNIKDISEVEEEVVEEEVIEETGGPEDTLVQELNLSTRTLNALDKAKIRKVGDIVTSTEKDLLELEGFGQTAMDEVVKSLKKLNLELKSEEE